MLGNKKDLPGALTERELIERMDLQTLAQVRSVLSSLCVSQAGTCLDTRTPDPGGLHILYLLQERGQHRPHAGVANEALAKGLVRPPSPLPHCNDLTDHSMHSSSRYITQTM